MRLHSVSAIALALTWLAAPAWAADAIPAYITAAVADSARPADEKAMDVDRKPAAVLAFTGLKPGDKVVDLMPGAGYYTRIFSKIVGAGGKVYTLQPDEMAKAKPEWLDSVKSIASDPSYTNVTLVLQPVAKMTLPEPVDMIWTSQNYHDLHDPFMGSPDMKAFDKTVFNDLKPGGVFIVMDHAAPAGSGFAETNTLHRVDPAAVKAEVMAAGFEFVGMSTLLANPADDHTLSIYNKALRDKTDRFIFKFRRPMR